MRLRALRGLFARAPGPVRSLLDFATPRLIAPRLPAFIARYADARAFHLPADEGPYAEIFTAGEFAPAESTVMRELLRPGDFVIDVGANLGWFSVLMGACVAPGGQVWAVEPTPPTLVDLERNVELNPDLDITVFPHAVGAEPGELEIHLFEGLTHGHASASALDRADARTYAVRVETLDGLLGDRPAPVLIKVDVEGSERDVLLGARETLAAECPPIWMIEVNYETSASFEYRPADLLEPFADGYRVFRIGDQGLVPEAEPACAPNGSNWIVVPSCREDRLARRS